LESGLINAAAGGQFAMWATFAIILATVIAYAFEKWSIEAVALASLVALLLLFTLSGDKELTAADLVEGFANPALVTVLALLVVGQALFQTDALEGPSQYLARFGGSASATLVLVLASAAGISAFLNNTPVVVLFIPILTTLARIKGFDAAKGLIPLSFATILGGATTLIGSSTNLLAAGIAAKAGITIGFFDFFVPGAMVAGVGMLYVVFVIPRFLQRRAGMAEQITQVDGRQFIAQIDITVDHPLEGAQSRAGMFRELQDMTVRAVLRGDVPVLPPFEHMRLQAGDSVIVAATRAALVKALRRGAAGIPLSEPEAEEEEQRMERNFTLAEAVVAPGSRYSARTIRGAGIRSVDSVVVLGVQRRSHMPRVPLSEIRLEPGDTLLVGGTPDNVARLRASRDLLLLDWSRATVPTRNNAPRALLVFAITVLLAAFELVPTMVAALIGALAMIGLGCINIRQASRAFDSRIFMMVGAAIAAATALEHTGGATYVANATVNALEGQPPAIILSAIVLVVAIATNFLSNNATALLFTPIAIRVAEALGVDAAPFIVGVIIAANCSFATPVGYQTNLLVMGPGHYRFSDFIVTGTPLVFLVWLTYSFVGPWYYGL
jgi:di/tricarboxylate transporter